MISGLMLRIVMMNRVISAMCVVLIAAGVVVAMVMMPVMMMGVFMAMLTAAMMDVVRIGFSGWLGRDGGWCCWLRGRDWSVRCWRGGRWCCIGHD